MGHFPNPSKIPIFYLEKHVVWAIYCAVLWAWPCRSEQLLSYLWPDYSENGNFTFKPVERIRRVNHYSETNFWYTDQKNSADLFFFNQLKFITFRVGQWNIFLFIIFSFTCFKGVADLWILNLTSNHTVSVRVTIFRFLAAVGHSLRCHVPVCFTLFSTGVRVTFTSYEEWS